MTLRSRLVVLTAVLIAGPTSLPAQSTPPPGKTPGFRLFEESYRRLLTNRVDCVISSRSELCTPAYESPFANFWPKRTVNNYIYNSGLQIAGIVGPDGGPWAGDVSGAFFFDMTGAQQHGEEAQPVVYRGDPADVAAWPEAARVSGNLYHPSLIGSPSVSEGDAWWVSWEGNPGLLSRPHPLGIAVEARALTWNYPGGNEDIVYFVFTYYNITSLDPADYAAIRPELRSTLLELATRFHDLNNTQFDITLPVSGYTIDSLFTAIAADPDVGDAGVNYSSVNLPFSLGYAYQHDFQPPNWWTFDPTIFSTPFFAGSGLAGFASLELPSGSGGLQMYSNITGGGGDLGAARGVGQLFRHLSGTLTPLLGDGACNFAPLVDHICFIRSTSSTDIRMFQSTGPFTIGPGESQSQVVAYVFAAPVGSGPPCGPVANCIPPGNSNIIKGLSDPAIVAGGVNPIDSIAGFLGASDLSGDGILQKDEFTTVPRSLYGKTQLAQAIFDHQFLLATAPAAPDFFLIPGDNQVTVIWRPTVTEQTGDPFFDVAKDAQVLNSQGILIPNPLYDPNFRQFDVEGYRVYRGRVDDPSALTMLVSFDYVGTVISDYSGQVNPNRLCAPELGITTDCPVAFDPIQPGVARSAHVDIPLVGEVVQIRVGDRIPLTDNSAFALRTDTTFAFVNGLPNCLCDTGIPFTFVDNTVRNNFRYFYSVTAFDINSVQSGPASFESPRILKSGTPVRPASNYENTADSSVAVFGRGVPRTDLTFPTLDSVTGIFSKPMPAATGWSLGLVSFVKEVVAAPFTVTIRLDSLALGDAFGSGGTCFGIRVPARYYVTVLAPADTFALTVPIVQDCTYGTTAFATSFAALRPDPGLASRYGGNGTYVFPAVLTERLTGNYYSNAFGRGCINSAPGFYGYPYRGCDYNGARWFDGPSPERNETLPHPNACATQVFTTNIVTCFSNAGYLTGVANVFEPKAYSTTPNVWRQVDGVLGGAVRGADYNVYWGANGTVDSVIDVSSNVVVLFDSARAGGGWGILNAVNTSNYGVGINYDQRPELTLSDISCVEPFRSAASVQSLIPCGSASYSFVNFAQPGPLVMFTGAVDSNRTMAPRPNPGFIMYMPGHLFAFEMAPGTPQPAAGSVWSLRDYIGAMRGGGDNCSICTAGADGPYIFSSQPYHYPTGFLQPFTAVGAELRLRYDVTNQVNPATRNNLSTVHTVPDPYYLGNTFEADAGQQVIKFVNLPQDAIIRIYSSSGVLVNLIEHHSTTFGGSKDWNVRNRSGRRLASGVYFYHIEAGNARRVGRLTIVNDRPGF